MKSTLLNNLPFKNTFKVVVFSLSTFFILWGIYLANIKIPSNKSLVLIFGGISLMSAFSFWLKYTQSKQKNTTVYLLIIYFSLLPLVHSVLRYYRNFTSLLIIDDIALFEHAGWLITTQKYIPYLHIWDIKPPLIYYVTSALSFLSGGNLSLLHLFGVAISIALSIGIIILVYNIILLKTNDHFAALLSVFMLLSFTYYNILPAEGLRPKYLSAFFGLLSIYFGLKNAAVKSGLMGGIAIWFYLPAGIFLLISMIFVFQHDKANLKRVILGVVISTIIVMIPFLFWGWEAFNAMLLEVFIGPTAGQGIPNTNKPRLLIRALKYNLLYIAFVVIGIFNKVLPKIKSYLGAITAFGFAVIALFLDLDGIPDTIIPYILVTCSLGIILSEYSLKIKKGIILLGILLSIVSVTWLGAPLKFFKPAHNTRVPVRRPEASNNRFPNAKYMVLTYYIPNRCHYRLSAVENIWIKKENLNKNAKICGFAEYPGIENFGEYISQKFLK